MESINLIIEQFFFLLLFVQFFSGLVTGIEFNQKGYSGFGGFFLGLILGILGIVVGLLIQRKLTPEEEFVKEMDELDKLAFHGGITQEECEKYKTLKRAKFEQYRKS